MTIHRRPELWLTENKVEIAAKIQVGYAAAQRGELIDSDQARALLDEKKRTWLAARQKNKRPRAL